MSHLFPVKAHSLANALRQRQAEIEQYNHECRGMPLGVGDGRLRLVLSTPEVMSEVRSFFDVKDCRVRFAFDEDNNGFRGKMPCLEVYNVDGALLTEPMEVSQISNALSNAIQVELFYFLLKTQGLNVPML
jgi:hypothetical protein